MKIYTIGKIFVILLIPLILLNSNIFAEDNTIEELHKKSAGFVSQSQFNEAIGVFDQILEIDPNNVKALINRSAVLIEIGQNEKAIYDTNRILAIDPNNVKALSNKGTALANTGYSYDAISIFEKAIELDPDNQKLINARNFIFPFIDLLLLSPENEKYYVHLQVQVRTEQDKLVSVTENTQSEYLPFKLTDKFLNDYPVIKIIEKNSRDYEMRQITHETDVFSEKAYGHMQLNTLCKTVAGCVHVFSGKTPSILVEDGNYIITQWTIYRLVE